MTITGLMNAKESDISSVLQAKIVPFITKREKAFRQSTSFSLSILVPVQRLNSAFFRFHHIILHMSRPKPTSGYQIPKHHTNTGAHTTLLASANMDTDRCKHEHYRKIGTDHTSLYSQGKGEHDEMTFDLISY